MPNNFQRRFELKKDIRELERDIDWLTADLRVTKRGGDRFKLQILIDRAAFRLERKRAELADIESAFIVPARRAMRMEIV